MDITIKKNIKAEICSMYLKNVLMERVKGGQL